jgi:hypothetical protein
MVRVREVICEYQPYVFRAPQSQHGLYQKAASNDGSTIEFWRDTWINNIKANKQKFGEFGPKGIGNLFGEYLHRPVICAGAGPSLKYSIEGLKNRKGIPLVSCLHNFQYFSDNGVDVDYWVTLDAGQVTVEEVHEGGKEQPAHYWEKTKGQTLLAFIGTCPELLEKWQGDIYFYNAMVPDDRYRKAIDEIEVFRQWVSNGGNVLGACLYISKAYLGAGAIIYVGADFSFGYDRKFHSFDSKYDKDMGACVAAVDVFGNKVATWPSYNNFKSWFDWVSLNVPGIYINSTEGGTLGAYPDGNIHTIRQMDLKDAIAMYSISEPITQCALDPKVEGDPGRTILF